MKTARQSLGRWGEELAAGYLGERGYSIIERNRRTPYGEIDLVVHAPGQQGEGMVVFVEVKTRSSASFGHPEVSVDRRKQEHLLNSALYYMQEHPELGCSWRIDVISIQKVKRGQPALLSHFENAVGGENGA
jgi:putative endonuclease